ncbi:MAG: type VI secretion system protein TssA [Desulfonauticus sp.]|nr:type VI secretion system protein TssA [Desulfonauticus sp.]
MDILELGKTPISEEKPAGEDARFEPEYEAIQAEIEKLSSPTATGVTDWQKVKENAVYILSKKAKDLLIAVYLSIALLHTDKIDGIYPGAVVLNDLFHNFWDKMFPPKKRKKGRINAILWWKDRIENIIAGFEPVTCKKEKRDEIIKQFKEIDSFLGENLEEIPPLRNLIEGVSSLFMEEEEKPEPVEAPKEEPKEDKPPEQPQTPAPEKVQETQPAPPPEAPSPSVEVELDMDDPQKVLEKGLEIVSKATTLMAKANPFDPEIFRLNRICAWVVVDALPLAEGGKTMLPPPDESIVSALKRLYESQNWSGLVEAAESYVPQFLFWLDLSRYSFDALMGLNQARAAEAVAGETLWYVKKLPGIEKLTFSDGTPFADELTMEWLREIKKAGSSEESVSGGGDKKSEKINEALKEIQEKIKSQKITEALLDFKTYVEQASCVSERFLWYIEVCKFLLKINKKHLLMPYVEEILTLIDRYRVEEWDPDICVKALEVTLRSIRSMGKEGDKEMEQKVLHKLSFLNPAVAMEFV